MTWRPPTRPYFLKVPPPSSHTKLETKPLHRPCRGSSRSKTVAVMLKPVLFILALTGLLGQVSSGWTQVLPYVPLLTDQLAWILFSALICSSLLLNTKHPSLSSFSGFLHLRGRQNVCWSEGNINISSSPLPRIPGCKMVLTTGPPWAQKARPQGNPARRDVFGHSEDFLTVRVNKHRNKLHKDTVPSLPRGPWKEPPLVCEALSKVQRHKLPH